MCPGIIALRAPRETPSDCVPTIGRGIAVPSGLGIGASTGGLSGILLVGTG